MLLTHFSTLFDMTGILFQYYYPEVWIVMSFIPIVYYFLQQRNQLPVINDRKPFEFGFSQAQKRFLADAPGLIKAGFAKAPAFRILTETGYKIVLSPSYAQEIRNLETLSFGRFTAKEFHAHVHGFEPFAQAAMQDQIFQDAIRTKLTQSLGIVTAPLSHEMNLALKNNWTDNEEWHDIGVRSTILPIVAQLSSRVFLGEEICRDPKWLQITVDYTVDSFSAAEKLRLWPWIIRPLVAIFDPACQKIKAELREANAIISPIVEKRRIEREDARRAGKLPKYYSDAIEWMEQCANGRRYNPETAQLSFSLAAIHTTADLLSQVLLDICGDDELINALRREIITAFNEHGWKKSMLYKLKLMDSTIKESQRLRPISIVSMRRGATADIKLSDGTKIPKGSSVMVSSHQMWDPSIYPNPETFDPYRFLKMRETPGNETTCQLVSLSPEHFGFGLGKHACPGRFFASNEIRIALCHILMKYDIAPIKNSPSQPRRVGLSLGVNATCKIAIRRRREEINL